MKIGITKTLLAVASAAFISAAGANAQAEVAVLEDFEAYDSGIGAWTVVDADNIAVELELGLTNPLEGLKCLRQIVGISLPGSNYTVQNLDLNLAIPSEAEQFQFSMKSLVALNLGRSVTVTLIDQDGVEHVSDPISLATLIISTDPTEISIDLSAFTPPIVGGGDTVIKGAKLEFGTSLAGIAGVEDLDSLQFTWESAPAAATGWMLYE